MILLIDVEKFHTVVKHIPNGFQEITRINKNKWKSFYDKLTILEEQKNQLAGVQKQLVTSKNDTFSNIEFFKATYFEMKLNDGKLKRIFEQKEKAAQEQHQLQLSKRKPTAQATIPNSMTHRCVSISPDEKK